MSEPWVQAGLVLYGPAAGPAYFLDNHDMSLFLAWTPDPNRLVADGAAQKSVLGESTPAPAPESRKVCWRLPALSTSMLAP